MGSVCSATKVLALLPCLQMFIKSACGLLYIVFIGDLVKLAVDEVGKLGCGVVLVRDVSTPEQ